MMMSVVAAAAAFLGSSSTVLESRIPWDWLVGFLFLLAGIFNS